jgi:hypothetical protein
MNDVTETVISTVCTSADRRVLIVLRPKEPLPIVLRTESFSPGVGWFTQQSINLSRSELQGLRNLLGVQVHRACESALASVEQSDSTSACVINFEAARQRTA